MERKCNKMNNFQLMINFYLWFIRYYYYYYYLNTSK